MQVESGDLGGAIATYGKALEASPANPDILLGRGIAYTRIGDKARAETDFAAARADAIEPGALNTLCWSKATAGVALESALTDCNAALSKAPEATVILDSRGLVFLRLGRLDEAITDFNRALAKNPNQPYSLFGRAVAWAGKGEKSKSDAAAAAADKIDPNVRADFEGYGVKL